MIQNVCKLQQDVEEQVTYWLHCDISSPPRKYVTWTRFFLGVGGGGGGGGGIASSIPWEEANGKPSSALIHLLANHLQELPKRMVSERKWQDEESSK